MLLRINFANEFPACVMDTFGCFRLVVFKKMKGKHDMLLVEAVNVNIKQTMKDDMNRRTSYKGT